MEYRALGDSGLTVSRLSFGASSLGGVFHAVDEDEAISAVWAALDAGITYFDVAPAYGATRSEAVLGRALRGIERDRYLLSTKVGKYTDPGGYGQDTLDYSAARIRASLVESAERLGTGYFDIVHLHDFEYQDRRHLAWALDEGLSTLHALKREGRIGAVSAGIYPMDLWHRLLRDYDLDAGLVHNHYCLNDTRLTELLPLAAERGVGLINGSPLGSGLLSDRGPADWHPASAEDRAVFRAAADYCRQQGTRLSTLAIQFACAQPDIATTLFSTSRPEAVREVVQWAQEPPDAALVAGAREILAPVLDKEWRY